MFVAMPLIQSLTDLGNGVYVVNGVCVCGLGAGMEWAFTMADGLVIPRCGKCARKDKTGMYAKITKETFDYFTALYVMTT